MSVKLKNGLIKTFCYLLSITGMAAVVVFQYFSKENPMPLGGKIAVPCLIGLLIFFLIYYKSLKDKINRKLIAVETAKELGKAGKTNTVVANLLETMGVVVPLLLIALVFVIGGNYLRQTGIVLFEILGLFTIVIIGNIICDSNTKQELKEQELKKAEELADKVASKLDNLPKRYE